MDELTEEVLRLIFELGLNRGAGYVVDPFVAELQWQDTRSRMLLDQPEWARVRMVKVP